jgi:histidine ammonia-lyase
MELNGMNSSVTPITAPVQDARPFPWLNGVAARTMDMISGSYLFNLDQVSDTGAPFRIIQDPESLRAMSQRAGSAWRAWDELRSDLAIQMNSSDHNPVVAPGWSPSSAPGLNSKWMMQYYVKGGPNNRLCKGGGVGPATGCQHGYIMSNANWDPYPIDNQIEAFSNALANLAVNQNQVPLRFGNTFFTVISPRDPSLPADQMANAAPGAAGYTLGDLMPRMQVLQNPVPAQGNALVSDVEDLEAGSHIKVSRARLMLDDFAQLLGQDLLTATQWMNIRQIQGQTLKLNRSFGAAPTAAWQAFRKVVPWQSTNRPEIPAGTLAYQFLKANPATAFYPAAAQPPKAAATPSTALRRPRKGAVRQAGRRTKRFKYRQALSTRHFLEAHAARAKAGGKKKG